MKPVSLQYHETRAEAQRCKPHSERKTVLTGRLTELLRRQIALEDKEDRRKARGKA
jgi:hypothetical protein